MAYWDPNYREPTEEERQATLEKLEGLTNRAKALEASIEEQKKAIVAEFMEYVEQGGLNYYEYDGAINGACYDFQNALRINEWDSTYGFWLPSNIGC